MRALEITQKLRPFRVNSREISTAAAQPPELDREIAVRH